MSAQSWVLGSVVSTVMDEFERVGGDAAWALDQCGLSRRFLANPHASVSLARYVAMFEAMSENLDNAMLGAEIGKACQPSDLGATGVIMSRSRSIAAALERLTRFVNSFQSGTQSVLNVSGDFLAWTYRLGDAAIWPRRQDAEFTVSCVIELFRCAFWPDWRPVEVQFEHSPASPEAAQRLPRLFGCPVRFDAASNGFLVQLDEARIDVRNEDRDLIVTLERFLADTIPREVQGSSWSSQVLTLISSYLGQQSVTLERLAVDLSVAPRTLQRRLAEEGTSLRALLRGHRREVAERQLQAGAAHLGNLAEALGYADGSTFWRAHRSWTGKSPSAVRRDN